MHGEYIMISQQTKEELKQLLAHIEENTLNLLESNPPDNTFTSIKCRFMFYWFNILIER